jgi:hypothetical protein
MILSHRSTCLSHDWMEFCRYASCYADKYTCYWTEENIVRQATKISKYRL